MERAMALALAVLGAGCNCNYLSRLFVDSTCKDLGGATASKTSLIAPVCSVPSTDATHYSISGSIACGTQDSNGQPTQCNRYANQAPFYAVLLKPDPNGTSFTAPSTGVTYQNCLQFWKDFSWPATFASSDILGVIVGNASANSVSCTDGAGCSSAAKCFSNFNPASGFFTDGTAVTVAPGNYLACAFIDIYFLSNNPAQSGWTGAGFPLSPTNSAQGLGWLASNWYTFACQSASDQNCLPDPMTCGGPCYSGPPACVASGTCATNVGSPLSPFASATAFKQVSVPVTVSHSYTVAFPASDWAATP